MFILRDLITPLQAAFSQTAQGQQRKVWFVYPLLAVAVPFTSSITSNVLRALFGLKIQSPRSICLYGQLDTAVVASLLLFRILIRKPPAIFASSLPPVMSVSGAGMREARSADFPHASPACILAVAPAQLSHPRSN